MAGLPILSRSIVEIAVSATAGTVAVSEEVWAAEAIGRRTNLATRFSAALI